jgi:hypothetical protein
VPERAPTTSSAPIRPNPNPNKSPTVAAWHIEAARKDPDADPDEAAAEFDARQGAAATTTGDDDQSVEHYERTADSDVEHERRFERNDNGEVVRDEQYEQPRTDR